MLYGTKLGMQIQFYQQCKNEQVNLGVKCIVLKKCQGLDDPSQMKTVVEFITRWQMLGDLLSIK